ncbi:MAG: hypothetical protein JWO96_599 [Candidatus Saccharibacteria bacterium]|nr:hypothetical protein [Candidatus Saccharibacteria bacterium]
MPKASLKPEDFIVPLNMNGLEGRMLRLPALEGNKREILFLFGQHSTIERWWGLALELNKLGAVTMPDLPGLGGMTPLYKIGQQPTFDNMADYLAAFVKLKFRNKKVTIFAMSQSFAIVTRMLQKYPELTKKVDILASVVGLVHKDDLKFSRHTIFIYKTASRILSRKWPARIFRYTALQPFVLKIVYHRTQYAREKFEEMSGDEFKRTMDMEVTLWHQNDIRTQFKHYLELFSLDLTGTRVDLPVLHVATKRDRYFNNVKVEEHMRRVYSDVEVFFSKAPNHAPTVIATASDAAPFIPHPLRRRIQGKMK